MILLGEQFGSFAWLFCGVSLSLEAYVSSPQEQVPNQYKAIGESASILSRLETAIQCIACKRGNILDQLVLAHGFGPRVFKLSPRAIVEHFYAAASQNFLTKHKRIKPPG